MGETTATIERHVDANPGVHFSAIERNLGLATGQTQYHLHKLLAENRVVSECVSGRTHYYAGEYDPWERTAIAFLRRETAREIITFLLYDGPCHPETIAIEFGIARSTVEWHVSKLTEHDIVRKDRRNQRIQLVLREPERTAALIRQISPTLPNQFVDRFMRTIDQLFE